MKKRLIFLMLFFSLLLAHLLSAIESGAQSFVIADDEVYIEEPGISSSVEVLEKRQSLGALRDIIKSRNQGVNKASMVLYEKGKARSMHTRRVLSSEILVRVKAGTDLAALASGLQAEYLGVCSFDSAWHRILIRDVSAVDQAREQLLRQPDVMAAELQLGRMHVRYSIPSDPYYNQQWHLAESDAVSLGVNAAPVWDLYRGDNIRIGIIDDGVAVSHPDLVANVNVALGYDFRDEDLDPSPGLGVVDTDDGSQKSTEDPHGTAVAGLAAGRGFNGIGGTGVAPSAQLAGLRLIGGYTTDAQEAAAFSHQSQAIHIKNNSWGPADHGDIFSGPGPLAHQAIEDATADGRGGLGTIFVFAAGNGLLQEDDSNKSGYTALPNAIAVSAIGEDGTQAYYSEPGANILICAPASDLNQRGLISSDLLGNDGYNHSSSGDELADLGYTQNFGGTSGAAPIVSGAVALMLNANPNLGWRDVQEILIKTAQKNDPTDAGWQTNASAEGYSFNRKYGAGLIDVTAAVDEALTWTHLGSERQAALQTGASLPRSIPLLSTTGITQDFSFTETKLRVEHVQVTLSIEHETRGDLKVLLTAPSGTSTELLLPSQDPESDIYDWTFMSTHFWGEAASGDWGLTVIDSSNGSQAGRLLQATLTLRGGETFAPVIPQSPSRLFVSRQWSNQALLSWEDNSNIETGFEIERCTDFASPWSLVATTGPNITSYYDYTVDLQTHYFYRVKAINGSQSSGYTRSADSYKTFGPEADLYASGFESHEGYISGESINNQQVWYATGTEQASAVMNGDFGAIKENHLRFGNTSVPVDSFHTATAYVPYYPDPNDLLTFTCKVAFRDNGSGYDDFYFGFYNLSGEMLFYVGFDMYYRDIYGFDGNETSLSSSASFEDDRVYTLTVTLDVLADTWSVDLDNISLFSDQEISSDSNLARNLGYIDLGWHSYEGSPNRNYMMVDDVVVSVSQATLPVAPELLSAIEIAADAIYVSWLDSMNSSRYELEYRAEGSSSWTTFDMSDFNEFDYPFVILQGLNADTNYEVRVRAENVHGDSAYSYESVTTYTLFEDWLSNYNLPTDLNPLTDYDGDGTVLMLEYALGLNPDSYFFTTAGLPSAQIETDASHITLTYYRARDDLNYTVLRSPDLSTNSWSATGVIQEYEVNGRKVTAAFPMEASSSFLRLQVSDQ